MAAELAEGDIMRIPAPCSTSWNTSMVSWDEAAPSTAPTLPLAAMCRAAARVGSPSSASGSRSRHCKSANSLPPRPPAWLICSKASAAERSLSARLSVLTPASRLATTSVSSPRVMPSARVQPSSGAVSGW